MADQQERFCYIESDNFKYNLTEKNTVEWGVQAGVKEQTITVRVPKDAPDLNNKEVKLVMNEIEYTNLFVADDFYADDENRNILIVDSRWFWQFKSCIKQAYIFNQVKYAGIAKNFNSFDSKTIAEYRYNENTINSSTEKPWSDYEILIYLLEEELGITATVNNYTDNRSIRDNQDYTGMSLPKVIGELSQRAGIVLYLDEDGQVILDDEADNNYTETAGTPTLEGKIYGQGYGIKPSKINVGFVKESEIELNNDLTGTWNLPNVVQMPFSSDDFGLIGGNEYFSGDYVLMDDLLEKLEVSARDIAKRYPTNNSIYTAFGKEMFVKTLDGSLNEKEKQKVQLASLIFSSFRRVFRIPQEQFDKLLNIKPFMVAIEDAYTKARKPSEIYLDWCSKVSFVTSKNPEQKIILNFPKSNKQAEVLMSIDVQAGVIAFSFGKDVFTQYATRYFGLLNLEGKIKDYATAMNARLVKPELTERFQFTAYVSANVITDYIHNIEMDIDYGGNGIGGVNERGEKLVIDKLVTRESARYDKTLNLVNEDFLNTIVKFEADLISFLWRYKATGMKTIGYTTDLKRLHGSLVRIAQKMGGGGGDYTVIQAVPRPAYVPDYSNLPPELRTLYFNTLG